MHVRLKVRPTAPKEIKPDFAREATERSVSLKTVTGWTLSKSRRALLHTAGPSLQFFDAPMWALAKERPEMKQIRGQTEPRTTWRCLLVPAPARGGRRLKNSCFTTGISPLPVDIEVRYCRELRQPTQLRQGAPRGIDTVRTLYNTNWYRCINT